MSRKQIFVLLFRRRGVFRFQFDASELFHSSLCVRVFPANFRTNKGKFDVVSGHPLRCTILITFRDSFRRRWLLLRTTFFSFRLVQLGKWAIPVLSCGLHFFLFNHTV